MRTIKIFILLPILVTALLSCKSNPKEQVTTAAEWDHDYALDSVCNEAMKLSPNSFNTSATLRASILLSKRGGTTFGVDNDGNMWVFSDSASIILDVAKQLDSLHSKHKIDKVGQRFHIQWDDKPYLPKLQLY